MKDSEPAHVATFQKCRACFPLRTRDIRNLTRGRRDAETRRRGLGLSPLSSKICEWSARAREGMSQQIQKHWPAGDGARTQGHLIVADLLGAVLSDRPLFRVFYHTHELTKYPIISLIEFVSLFLGDVFTTEG